MNYKEHQRRRWNSLAAAHGEAHPLRAVIGSTELGNEYFDRATKRLLSRVLRVKQGEVVLDYGCGVGRLSLWFASRAQRVIGMDISPKMIETATNRASAEGARNTTFTVIGDGRLPFETGSIDVVVCCAVLKYILDDEDLARLVGEIDRVLNAGGRVAIMDEVDQTGPIALSGSEDIGEASLLRRPQWYEAIFRQHHMTLRRSCPLYHRRLLKIYALIGAKIARHKIPRFVDELVIAADLRLESLLRKRVNTVRGFRLLYFEKDVGS